MGLQVFHFLLIAAAMFVLPVPGAHAALSAEPQPTAASVRGTPPPGLLVVQTAAAIAGTYAGRVDRRTVNGEARATRTYRLTMNPDMNTGKVLIYDLDGNLLNEIALVGKMTDGERFDGQTIVINASPNYIPDNVRLVFSPDRSSVRWYHNDGTLEGTGTLSHLAE